MLKPGEHIHHPRCPHLIATLQRVVDEVSLPMWMTRRPPYWCGALADQELGQWRPPPARRGCTPPSTATGDTRAGRRPLLNGLCPFHPVVCRV